MHLLINPLLFISLYASYLCKRNESMHMLINPRLFKFQISSQMLFMFQNSYQISTCLMPFLKKINLSRGGEVGWRPGTGELSWRRERAGRRHPLREMVVTWVVGGPTVATRAGRLRSRLDHARVRGQRLASCFERRS
jgi:hypothetical protein